MTNTIESIKALPDAINAGCVVIFSKWMDTITTDDLKALVARLERAEAAIDDAMGQGTWDAAFNVLAEYQDKP